MEAIRFWSKADEDALRLGFDDLAESLTCQLSLYNSLIGGEETLQCHYGQRDLPKRSVDVSFDVDLHEVTRRDTCPALSTVFELLSLDKECLEGQATDW